MDNGSNASQIIREAMEAIEKLARLGKPLPQWPGGYCPICAYHAEVENVRREEEVGKKEAAGGGIG